MISRGRVLRKRHPRVDDQSLAAQPFRRDEMHEEQSIGFIPRQWVSRACGDGTPDFGWGDQRMDVVITRLISNEEQKTILEGFKFARYEDGTIWARFSSGDLVQIPQSELLENKSLSYICGVAHRLLHEHRQAVWRGYLLYWHACATNNNSL